MNEMTDKERTLIVQLKARNEELLKVQKKYGNLKAITTIICAFVLFFSCMSWSIGSESTPVAKTVVQTQLVYVTSEPTNVPSTISTRTPTRTPYPTKIQPSEIGAFGNPIPFRQSCSCTLEDGGSSLTFTFTVRDIIARGETAWSMIYTENQFNEEPVEDMEYIIVSAYVSNVQGRTILDLNSSSFSVVSNRMMEEAFSFVVWGKDSVKLLPGGEGEIQIVGQVHIGDKAPLLFFGNPFSNEGLYFSLQ
jgi:hypothetical protein